VLDAVLKYFADQDADIEAEKGKMNCMSMGFL
jgi:hypothetical protein